MLAGPSSWVIIGGGAAREGARWETEGHDSDPPGWYNRSSNKITGV